jgi:hypothetical protein
MAKRRTTPSTYLERLLAELEGIRTSYAEVLVGSAITKENVSKWTAQAVM